MKRPMSYLNPVDIPRVPTKNALSDYTIKKRISVNNLIIAKGFRTVVLLIMLVLFFTGLPTLIHAQGTDGTLTGNDDTGTIGYAMMGPSNEIAVIDMDNRKISGSIAVEGNPHGGALTPDGNYIYTSSMGSKWISVVDTRTKEVVARIDIGSISHHAVVRPDGQYVYVAAGQLIVIATATNKIVARIETRESPFYPVFAPDGRRLYVQSMGGSFISVIDTKTNKQVDTIDTGAKSMMGHLAVAPDGKTLYATSDITGRLSIIDTRSGQLRKSIVVGKQPHGIAVSADGTRVFVGTRGETNIKVYDPVTAKIVATRTLGGFPEHLSMTADSAYLLVGLKNRFREEESNRNGSRKMTAAVAIIDPYSLKIVEEIPAWPQVHDILVF